MTVFTPKVWQDAPGGGLLLQSPNGHLWQLATTDTGALQLVDTGASPPAGGTPLDAAAIGDLETRLSGYTDARIPQAASAGLWAQSTAGGDVAWTTAAASGFELIADKGAASGYMGLDAGSRGAQSPKLHKADHEPGGADALTALTDANVAAANKDGTAATSSMRTLGAGAQQAMAGNDIRVTGLTPNVFDPQYAGGASVAAADNSAVFNAIWAAGKPVIVPALASGQALAVNGANLTAIPAGCGVVGAGSRSLLRVVAAATGSLLSASGVSGLILKDFWVDGNRANAPSSVDAIHLAAVTDSTVQGVHVQSAVSNGIHIATGCARVRLSDFGADDCVSGLLIDCAAGGTTTRIQASRGHITNSRNSGASGGWQVSGVVQYCQFAEIHVENSAGHNLYVTSVDAANICQHNGYTDCTFVGAGAGSVANDYRGVTVFGAQYQRFTGGAATGNMENGYYVADSGTVSAIGNVFVVAVAYGNNTGNRAGGHGFEFDQFAIAIGCQSHHNGAGATGTSASHGFWVGVNGALLIGPVASYNANDGVHGTSPTNTAVIAPVAWNNSQRSAGAADGVSFSNGGTNYSAYSSIIGAIGFDTQGTPTQRYGVNAQGTIDALAVLGAAGHGNQADTTHLGVGQNGRRAINVPPISADTNFTTPTVGASPWTYTNATGVAELVNVQGGTGTTITLNAGGGAATIISQAAAGFNVAPILLLPGWSIVVTYTAAPNVRTWNVGV